MIYFSKDWYGEQNRPRAMAHLETQNTSFIRMSKVLKRMGIQNHLFHLALMDPDLYHVDPHNLKDTSNELKLKIAYECRYNPWYYFREVIRVPAPGGLPIPFIVNRANLSMMWCYYNNIDYIGIAPRQTGKTIGAICITSHVLYFFGYNISMALLTKDATLLQENVARLRDIRNALPSYLIYNSPRDADNKEGMTYASLLNEYRTYIGNADPQAADRLGRGMSFPTFHNDEGSFTKNIQITLPVMLMATTAAARNAKANKQPHSNIYTTTPGRVDTVSGRFMYDMVQNAMPFTEKLYDCQDLYSLENKVKMNATNGIVNGTFSYLQLGYTHEWLRDVISKVQATEEEIARDFLLMWKSGSDSGLVDAKLLQKMNDNRREPDHIQIRNDYVLNWYVPEQTVTSPSFKQKKMVLGMDSSDAVGQDFTALVLMDPTNMTVLATFQCNESNITQLAVFLGKFLMDYPNTVLIPERKSTGASIIDTVILMMKRQGANPFQRIYNKVVQEKHTSDFQDVNIHEPSLVEGKYRRHLGFVTTGTSRDFLFKNVLTKAMRLNAPRIYDRQLISEISGLTVRNGRVDHQAGKNDDLVIAYLLCCYFCYNAQNRHHYGFNFDDFMETVHDGQVAVSAGYKHRQMQLRKQIKELKEHIEETTSETLKTNLLSRMKDLELQLDPNLKSIPVSTESVTKQDLDGDKIPSYNDVHRTHVQTKERAHHNVQSIFHTLF